MLWAVVLPKPKPIDQQVLLRNARHLGSEQALHQEAVHLGDHVVVVWIGLHVARFALHVHQHHRRRLQRRRPAAWRRPKMSLIMPAPAATAARASPPA
jgi:hypothetical protein